VATGAAAAACLPLGGVGVTAWVLIAATVVDWSYSGRPPLPFLPDGDPATRLPVFAALAVAAAWGWASHSRLLPLALCGAALLTTLLGSVAPRSFARASVRISEAVAAVLSRVVFAVLGVLLVVVPWLGQRLVRSDPLDSSSSSSWLRRARRSVRPQHPWTTESRLDGPAAGARFRRRLVAPALLVLGLGAAVGWSTVRSPDETLVLPAAFTDQPEAAAHLEDMGWFMPVAYDPTDNPRIRDVRSRTINVRDGRRVSWTPPDCDCRRVKLWVFGGSTGFGLGQRDEHTIPSELARLAWEDGYAVDVDNYGVPGDMLLRESQSFAWELEHRPTPDVAVFYDGINDMAGALHLQDHGCATRSGPPVDPALDRVRERDLAEFGTGGHDPEDGPGTARVLPTCNGKRVSTDGLAELAVDHYERALDIGRVAASAHGVDVHWYWQPSLFTRRVPVQGEPTQDDGGEWSRRWWAAARKRLPKEVVDVADALDDVPTPVYYDTMHHNEHAAGVIAAAIYRDLRPAIVRAASAAP
jgi:hypothetical protein